MNRFPRLSSFACAAALSASTFACGQTADYNLDSKFDTTTESDGRITVKATVYCFGSGDENCEDLGEPYCVTASWDAAEAASDAGPTDAGAGARLVESTVACATRPLAKKNNVGHPDVEVLTVTSLEPIPTGKASTLRITLKTKSGRGLYSVDFSQRTSTSDAD